MKKTPEFVDVAAIPGVFMVNDEPYADVGGKAYRVTGAVRCGESYIPVVDIPMVEEQPVRPEAEVCA